MLINCLIAYTNQRATKVTEVTWEQEQTKRRTEWRVDAGMLGTLSTRANLLMEMRREDAKSLPWSCTRKSQYFRNEKGIKGIMRSVISRTRSGVILTNKKEGSLSLNAWNQFPKSIPINSSKIVQFLPPTCPPALKATSCQKCFGCVGEPEATKAARPKSRISQFQACTCNLTITS